MDNLIHDLQTLIRQPSVSARKQGLIECANLVSHLMHKAGIKSELLHIEDKKGENVAPIVYGEVKSKANPNGKTILFYNHYDVQPEDPVDLWNYDPFGGEVKGNYIFGRGSSDDKGELITRIKAVEYFLKETGDVPCNVKFIVEGEEETGSANLEGYLIHYREKLDKCDGVIWESSIIDEKNRPIIQLGVKGILSVELITNGPFTDVHSSLAVLIENPAWRLITALTTLRDANGAILIKDWYKEVKEITAEELSALANEPFEEEGFKKEHHIDKFVNNIKAVDANKALATMPTCNIAGLVSGHTSEGIKNIIPARALAKIDFRLIPDMMPEKQFERLKNHLTENGFTDIDVKFLDGEPAAKTPIKHPFVRIVDDAAKEIFGTAIISISSAGAGPMYYFHKVLNVPCVSVGSTYIHAKIHSPNEFARIDLLNKTTKCIGNILDKFANL